MSKPGHDITIKVNLTHEQYWSLVNAASEDDVSHSSFMRRLLISDIKSRAHDAAKRDPEAMPANGQEWA